MRPEQLYLTDIVQAADAVGRFASGITYDDFVRDELRQSAILQKLTVIGEADCASVVRLSVQPSGHRVGRHYRLSQHCRA